MRTHLWITGRVQGVYYRATTQTMAHQLGVMGWVRNLRDGRVEAVFEGEALAVAKLVQWCGSGPPNARVDEIESVDEVPQGECEFRVLPTTE